jgi:hypothetical protein
MKRWGAGGAVLVLMVLAGVGGLAAWLAGRDPLGTLPRVAAPVTVAAEYRIPQTGRELRHLSFRDETLGKIGLVVSLPDPLPDRRLPVVVVLGGLGTGAQNIAHVGPAGDNAVVGYDWPMPPDLSAGWGLLRAAPDLYRRVLTVPGQMAAGLDWVLEQPWADRERVSLLGFSLGALAAPATQRVADQQGQTIGWTVLAYGGAPLGALLAGHPRVRPDWLRPIVGELATLLLRPVDPVEHLPHLTGRFLLLGSRADELIPQAAADRMRAVTPEPKTVVLFTGDHMGVGPGQMELLERIVRTSTEWLIEMGAVNPPTRS